MDDIPSRSLLLADESSRRLVPDELSAPVEQLIPLANTHSDEGGCLKPVLSQTRDDDARRGGIRGL